MNRYLIFLTALAVASGCYVGPSVDRVRRDFTPQGVEATVFIESRRITGELIALQDDGFLFLPWDSLMFVSYSSIRSAQFSRFGAASLSGGNPPNEDQRENLRILSRYPQGVDQDLLSRLLLAYDQKDLGVLK